MRTVIQINKEVIIFFMIFILGISLLVQGIISEQKKNHAVAFDNLEYSEIKEGNYITGTINSYLVKDIENLGTGTVSGVSNELFTAGKHYLFYTVPIKNNYYIRIMLSDKDKINLLEELRFNNESRVYFEGEIISSPIEFNYEWYKQGGLSTENIVYDYVIKEISIKDKVKKTYIGIFLILLSVIGFWGMGGTKQLFYKEKIRNTNDIEIQYSYNLKNELVIEKEYLKTKYAALRSLKKGCICAVPFVVIGIKIIISSYFWEVKLIGFFMLVFSIKSICKYLLNSGWKVTDTIMHLMGNISLQEEIIQLEKKIEAMKELIQLYNSNQDYGYYE